MSSITNQPFMQGVSPRQNSLSDAQFSSYVRKESLRIYESLDAGLIIKTKEGDSVTLTSNTYAGLDAFMYDRKGVIQTESGTTFVTQNLREVTLTSGESFTFSVEGDLSEAELEDIEAIVKGIDQIISEMAKGDMDGAFESAISMGGYDTVSMYAADITYQKTTAMTKTTRAETLTALPESQIPQRTEAAEPLVKSVLPENQMPLELKNMVMENIYKLIEKMVEELEKFDEKLVDKAEKPIDKLFRHHLRNGKNTTGETGSTYNAVDTARNHIENWFENHAKNRFEKQIEKLLAKMPENMVKDPFSTQVE